MNSLSTENMAEIDDFDVEAFLASVTSEHLPLQVEDLAYQGFNPAQFLRVMREKSKEAKVLEDHKKNMVKMGLVCSIKSCSINKVLSCSGTSLKWRSFLDNMKKIYGLQDSKADSPTAVTLSRVLFVTSLPVVKYYYQDNGKHITPVIRPAEVINGYPFCMCTNGFAALIPISVKATEVLSKAFAYYQYLQAQKMGGKISKDNIMKYVGFLMKNPLYPDTNRLAILNDFGILTVDGRLTESFSTAITGAAAKFDDLA